MRLETITLQFVREARLTSDAIAWFSQGHFSHVEAVIQTIDRRSPNLLGSYEQEVRCAGSTFKAGVQLRPFGYRPLAHCVRFSLTVTEDQKNRWLRFLLNQIGSPYDWPAIWGFVSGRDWRQPGAWICSELQAAALEAAGIFPQLYLAANKVTPVFLAGVLSGRFDLKTQRLI